MQFRGAFTALVTPFRNGAVDEERYRELVEWQIENGINGLVPCGTTGESATLSHEEHREVIRICVEQANKRVPVLAGAGSNNTKEAIDLTRFAKEAGADGALLITPYYNKPTQEGLYQHFKAIAEEVSLPFILYNVPGRTGTNMLPCTLARLKKDVPQVKGVKEATGNLAQVSDILEQCGPDFQVVSGDDFTVLPLLSLGGCGVISVVSNIIPDRMAGLCKAFAEGNLDEARRLHFDMQGLCRAMFIETNPIPVKTSLSMMGKISLELRLPMVPLAESSEKALQACLKSKGII
ncbi:4-hydroxy-tetrahydrodipicolinate synthase [Desulfovibrio psychrotolerans]|uniref:4-hydroxy-tetrahydrodipicolinate synthase n=1 Tax=Desulfovibrio psychrotolerans TaxID=415242 RepID=A0A7J0BQE1_9BACT|nr:4-hydroxy-tetrahydrodipicolinate synthase [Desulfovibrio psychrotolerans]GFM35392.1 4-hydroxy-tetrahydrodipicolinate synthase [Desulfovibrio psychrotolerans]